jgi:putative hemolysin
MKKVFWIFFVLILLVGTGFMYLVKNPQMPFSQKVFTTIGLDINQHPGLFNLSDDLGTGEDLTNCTSYFDGCNTCMVSGGVIGGCTKMLCKNPTQPTCLAYKNTGIDLTNCVSYFDGCNTCSVKDGKPDACTLMYCETPGEPKCNEYASGTTNNENVGLANPASTNCVNNGGKLDIVTSSDGGQQGMCTLSDGTVCEERAYMKGTCVAKNQDNDETNTSVCTMEYAPVCASVQVQCIKAPCDPIQQTFGNTCMMKANKHAIYLHDGECAK